MMVGLSSSPHNTINDLHTENTTVDDDDKIFYDEDYVDRMKERFETCFEAKYGGLWRNMIETQQVKVRDNTATPRKPLQHVINNKPSRNNTTADNRSIGMGMSNGFLGAIQNKQTISIAVPPSKKQHAPSGNDCDCGCVPPILDWEDGDSESIDKKENHSKTSSIMGSIDHEHNTINNKNDNINIHPDEVEGSYPSDYETPNEYMSDNSHDGEHLDGSHETSVAPWDEMESPNESCAYQQNEEVEVDRQRDQDELSWNHECLNNPPTNSELGHGFVAGTTNQENRGNHNSTGHHAPARIRNDVQNDEKTERGFGESRQSRSNNDRFDVSQVFHSSSSQNEYNDDISQSNESGDESSNSSGRTRVHFDISYIVQSSPERAPGSSNNSSFYPKQSNAEYKTESRASKDMANNEKIRNESLSSDQCGIPSALQFRPEGQIPTTAVCQEKVEGRKRSKRSSSGLRSEDEKSSGDGSNSSESSEGTRIHFDISHLVQSPSQANLASSPLRTPNEQLFEPETSPRLSLSGIPCSRHTRQNQEGRLARHNKLESPFRQHELSDIFQTPRINRPRSQSIKTRTPTPKKSSLDSVQSARQESVSRSSRVDMTDSDSVTGGSVFERSETSQLPSETPGSNATQPPASNTEKSTLNGSILIDLLDSESEDESTVPKQNVAPGAKSGDFSEHQIKPRARRAATRRVIIDDSDSDTESDIDISSQEQEWDDNTSSSECSFQSPDEESNSITGLIEKTKKVTLSIESEGSGEDEEEGGVKTKHRREMTQQKMTKTTFRRKRDTLTNQYFAEFDQAAFSGLLSSVDVTWSNKLRTTAGQTRLKRSVTNMTPGVPQDRSASIELSTKVLDDPERLRTTLLHEMVHAAAWIVDGVSKPPHGQCFKKWANIAMRNIPSAVVTTTHSYEIEYKYTWACSVPGCNFIVRRHSKSVDVKKHCCGKCRGRIYLCDTNGSKSNRTRKKSTQPSAYNLFVKEKSKIIREQMAKRQLQRGLFYPKVSQSDIMKECARLWQAQKKSA